MTELAMWTDAEIAWAKRELERRINEQNMLARDPRIERRLLVERSRRSRAAGLSRARHHALLAYAKETL